ncbi:sodium-independent anion transporter [bacterium M21]|nr:sodium-independent anion transporter [bacterium M21]
MTEKVASARTKRLRNTFIKLIVEKPGNLKNDLLSGITVALALVPEAIAFSFVAHVDPRVGLYAAFMMGLITSVLGGRPGMISGSTGAVAVIFAPLVIAQTKLGGMDHALGCLFAAVALMGVLQMIFGVFKLGKFVRLIPHPVMLGFVNGLAIVIFKAQFSQFYIGSGDSAKLLATQPLVIMLAMILLTMVISAFLPKLTKAVPATLTAIVVVSLLGIYLNKNGIEIRTVMDFVRGMDPTKTTIAASLPTFSIPQIAWTFDTLKMILPYSVLAAAVGLIESLMTLTLVDELTDTRGRGNRECVGQGIANVVNGFFGGMGGCAMIGQSMINIRAGGRSRWSGASAALFLLALVVWGAGLIEMIPLAALVGVMFMVVIGTFEWSSLRIINKIPRSDAFIIIMVSATTVVFDLAIAVLVGIIVSALVFAWEHGKHMHAVQAIDAQGRKIYELDGPLFFGSVTSFKDLFDFKNDPEHVVIDFANSRVCDHSSLEALDNVTERYLQAGKKLHLLNLSKECKALLKGAEKVIELSVIEDMEWHIAEDSLG